jgi:hypothetical protein
MRAMRALPAVALVALVVLAGCQAPMQEPTGDVPGVAVSDAPAPPDPTTDRLGYEDGYWYNESLAVNATDGLNETEQRAVVGRAMARVERIRELEFEERVPVRVLNRSAATAALAGNGSGSESEAFQRFDNAKFEALFLVGERDESIQTQQTARNRSIAGYYSRSRGAIVVVSDSPTPTLDRNTLSHELVHALQDQHFEDQAPPATRDAFNGRNGLYEGDANYVQQAYEDRCEGAWDCLDTPERPAPSEGDGEGASEAGPTNRGVTVLQFFPYSDGPSFVASLRAEGGWAAVNEAYADPPASAREVIDPTAYPEFTPTEVELDVTARDGWRRVRPAERSDAATLGPSAIATAFAATLYDSYNEGAVVSPRAFLNVEPGGQLNATDPLNYDLPGTRGWRGDRLEVYERNGETAYVWRLVWDGEAEATAFAERYRALLTHWGGQEVSPGTWVLEPESPYADAVRVTVEGDTVTVVNAPTRDDLDSLRPSPPE